MSESTIHGINHVALRVSDMATSRDFYVELLGATVLRETERFIFLRAGGADFLALFPSDEPHIEHYCFTVEDYEPDDAQRCLEELGLTVHRREDRVFARDADGAWSSCRASDRTTTSSPPWDVRTSRPVSSVE